jgi:3-oxoacyl-[acyl-carrier-protein] synthase II
MSKPTSAPSAAQPPKVAVYGWGLVAPRARNMAEFARVLQEGGSALSLATDLGLGRRLFMVGNPAFDLEDYRSFIVERSGEARFAQLGGKMGDNALFAMGATIQAVQSNPGLEEALRAADHQAHIYIGSGVGDIAETANADAAFRRASRVWNRFWADPIRCPALRRYREDGHSPPGATPPRDPSVFEVDSEERLTAREQWDAFWASHSAELETFERRYAEIEGSVLSDDDKASLDALKARQRVQRKLIAEVGCPTPPWVAVDPRMLWAIQNVPAAQVSMLLGLHGAAFAPVAACSTFGVAVKLGYDAIVRGEAKLCIVGTTDPRPHPALVSAFHRSRLVTGCGAVNYPLTGMLGTHVSGGACIWVLGEASFMRERGLHPIAPEVAAVTVSSDAEHIITPSAEGPKVAIRSALGQADASPSSIAVWDMHATGTPGDLAELKLIGEFLGPRTQLSARKGIFGHGMANAGGWELTALALDVMNGRSGPSGIPRASLHPAVEREHGQRLGGAATGPLSSPVAAKLMLGIGGITACVILRKSPPGT